MSQLKKEYKQKNSFLRNWGAVIILAVFFIGSWAGQFINQLQVEKQQATAHGQQFNMADFYPQFWSSTFENWQSEWLQLLTQALLISGFAAVLFRKQDEEHFKTQLMIEELQQQVKALKKK